MLAGKALIVALESVVAGRAVHVLFTAENIRAVEAIQVGLGNLRHQAPVWDRLSHSIDGSLSREGQAVRQEKHPQPKHPPLTVCWPPHHAGGLGVEVLHDVLDAVPEILQELLSNARLRVQLRDAEMDAGQEGEKAGINHLQYTQLHLF